MKFRFPVVLTIIASLAATSAGASVQISTDPTSNMNCTSGVCTPTAQNAFLNTTDLANMLAASDVKVTTGSGAVTITVVSPFSWTSTHRLTLDANLNVSFKAPVDVDGQGAVTITTNDGGTGGDLIFFDGGKLDFSNTSSSLIINAASYVLLNNVATLSADIASRPFDHYALAQDYDALSDGQYLGSPVSTFFGTFDGLGHRISNLTIHSKDSVGKSLGLFAEPTGTLQNINLANTNVTVDSSETGWSVGSLAGTNGGIIRYSSVTGGAITDATNIDAYFGGIAGTNGGQIIHASAKTNVTGLEAGGLAGLNGGIIADSSAESVIQGEINAGGIVGVNSEGQIVRCHATGAVSARRAKGDNGHSYIGGLAGSNPGGQISQSFFAGSTIGFSNHTFLGGLVGWNRKGRILQSYALGTASAEKRGEVGGLVGYNSLRSSVTQVYSAAQTSGATNTVVGGAIGVDITNAGRIKSAFWDLDTSGISDPQKGAGDPLNDPGITGLTDAQLKSGLPAGFDPSVWAHKKNINNGYPYLIANPPL